MPAGTKERRMKSGMMNQRIDGMETTKMSKQGSDRSASGWLRGTVFTVGLVWIALAVLASPASASQAINGFEVATSTTQAGGHPDLSLSFELDSPGEPESARNVIVNAPEGVFGNPNAIPKCNSEDFGFQSCATAAQEGVVTVYANYSGEPSKLLGTAPVFNREPVGDETALFAFIVPILNIPVSIPVTIRTASDYGLRFRVSELTQLAPLAAANISFWGFPGKDEHNSERFPRGELGSPAGCPELADTSCFGSTGSPISSLHPFINNPSICTGEPLAVSVEVQTYQDPLHPSTGDATYPETTGCYKMVFNPVLLATPTSFEADSPAGLDIQMKAPQPLGEATTPSPIKSATLTLPDGLTINPDAADGQSACRDADANFDTEGPGECPDNAKIGTFAIGSPALDDPLNGSIYIGEPKPGDQYRFFLIADGFGIHAKLLGAFRPDPATGRVTAYIKDLPQVPFETFDVHLFASDRGLMATPTQCSVYEVGAQFFPWNDFLPDQHSLQVFGITSGPHGSQCPGQIRPFRPTLAAGTKNPTAGSYSDFALQLDREDGDQFLGDLNFRMPPGFTGDLRGISYCSESSIAAAALNPGRTEQAIPSCPASSQIGTTNVAAGPGGHPFHTVGKMYLGGPLKGAPLSIAAITPALAGPYDYGTVVVRVALHVDPGTAQVFAASDPVPSIIGGVPIRMRSIRVSIDRPNFTINPTNCSPLSVDSQGIGDQGTVAEFSSYFHAVDCFKLPFEPKMAIRQLGGRKRTARSKDPALRFDLWTRSGDANLKRIAVILPKAFAIDQRHLGNICSRSELASKRCEGRQAIGSVQVDTPQLDQPLTGPAYAVSGFGKLPHIVFILGGQVMLLPEGESSSVRQGHLKTVVPVIPDAKIGHFRLNLLGGKQGYIVNTRDLCASRAVAKVIYVAHNSRRHVQKVKTRTACGKTGPRKRRSDYRR
jgi:hypothetical protein